MADTEWVDTREAAGLRQKQQRRQLLRGAFACRLPCPPGRGGHWSRPIQLPPEPAECRGPFRPPCESTGATDHRPGGKSTLTCRRTYDPRNRPWYQGAAQSDAAEVQTKEGMESFIRRDSRVIIRKRYGLAGASYLEITRGKEEPLDWDYAVIKAEADRAPTDTLAALIDDLQQRAMPLIDDAHTAIRNFSVVARELQNPQGDLRMVLRNLNDITGNISRGEGTVGRLVTQKDMADTLETTLKQLGEVLEDLRQTASDLPRITGNVGEASANLPQLLLQTEQVMVQLEAVRPGNG